MIKKKHILLTLCTITCIATAQADDKSSSKTNQVHPEQLFGAWEENYNSNTCIVTEYKPDFTFSSEQSFKDHPDTTIKYSGKWQINEGRLHRDVLKANITMPMPKLPDAKIIEITADHFDFTYERSSKTFRAVKK